jgi:hypothetical protein
MSMADRGTRALVSAASWIEPAQISAIAVPAPDEVGRPGAVPA